MADEKHRVVQAWLRRADDDLRSAQVDLAADPPLIEDALFHCQQAAEKAMKPFLTARDLTVFAWAFRYPGTDEAPPKAEANDSLRVARAAVAAIRERLERLA
jgi:hypothetical protein